MQIFRIAAAGALALAMAGGAAWAGDTGHRITITNKSAGPIAVQSFDADDYSFRSQRQEVRINPNGIAAVQCNSPSFCHLRVTYEGARRGMAYPLIQRENRSAMSITYNDGAVSGSWSISY